MNPAKRKKLYRLELQKKHLQTSENKETKANQLLEVKVEEKVIQKEEVIVQPSLLSEAVTQSTTDTSAVTEMALKLPESDVLEAKKEKKKRFSSQD